jgi:hypothetical protein
MLPMDGFADRYLSQIVGVDETQIRAQRVRLGEVAPWPQSYASGANGIQKGM